MTDPALIAVAVLVLCLVGPIIMAWLSYRRDTRPDPMQDAYKYGDYPSRPERED
jgi:hypothetical protein